MFFPSIRGTTKKIILLKIKYSQLGVIPKRKFPIKTEIDNEGGRHDGILLNIVLNITVWMAQIELDERPDFLGCCMR